MFASFKGLGTSSNWFIISEKLESECILYISEVKEQLVIKDQYADGPNPPFWNHKPCTDTSEYYSDASSKWKGL
jgi:hypothetical protein